MKQAVDTIATTNIEAKSGKHNIIHIKKGASNKGTSPTTPQIHSFVTADSNLPKSYYRSTYFLKTFFTTTLSQTSAAGTYIIMAAVLTQINEDIGPDKNIL